MDTKKKYKKSVKKVHFIQEEQIPLFTSKMIENPEEQPIPRAMEEGEDLKKNWQNLEKLQIPSGLDNIDQLMCILGFPTDNQVSKYDKGQGKINHEGKFNQVGKIN